MRRFLAFLFLLPVAVFAGDNHEADFKARLEKIRSMTPEQRAQLKARLEAFRKLPPEERQRVRDNLARIKAMPAKERKRLKERVEKLHPEDKRAYSELASGFFKWGKKRQLLKGFPRGLFFTWLRDHNPGELERLRDMDASVPGPRVDAFIKLYHEFRVHALDRLTAHARRHGCFDPARIDDLRALSPVDLWPRFHELARSCSPRPRK